jgi:hypothetical protein
MRSGESTHIRTALLLKLDLLNLSEVKGFADLMIRDIVKL